MQIMEPLPLEISYLAGLGQESKIWISNKFPGDVDAAGPGTTLVQGNVWDQEMTRKSVAGTADANCYKQNEEQVSPQH